MLKLVFLVLPYVYLIEIYEIHTAIQTKTHTRTTGVSARSAATLPNQHLFKDQSIPNNTLANIQCVISGIKVIPNLVPPRSWIFMGVNRGMAKKFLGV